MKRRKGDGGVKGKKKENKIQDYKRR